MSVGEIFTSVICASCGGCPYDTLCSKCETATLKANGLHESLTHEISGLRRKNGSGGSFQYSDLYKKLSEISLNH